MENRFIETNLMLCNKLTEETSATPAIIDLEMVSLIYQSADGWVALCAEDGTLIFFIKANYERFKKIFIKYKSQIWGNN
jgi:hypothetical protein